MLRKLIIAGAALVAGLTGLGVLLIWGNPRNRPLPAAKICQLNLKCIDAAKASWSLDNHITNVAVGPKASDLYGSTNYLREVPVCPKGGTYVIATIREKPRCSYPGHTL